jgi:hypothetical protein
MPFPITGTCVLAIGRSEPNIHMFVCLVQKHAPRHPLLASTVTESTCIWPLPIRTLLSHSHPVSRVCDTRLCDCEATHCTHKKGRDGCAWAVCASAWGGAVPLSCAHPLKQSTCSGAAHRLAAIDVLCYACLLTHTHTHTHTHIRRCFFLARCAHAAWRLRGAPTRPHGSGGSQATLLARARAERVRSKWVMAAAAAAPAFRALSVAPTRRCNFDR